VNAFVTGATGFIGYHVASLLKDKGFDVTALVRSGSDITALQSIGVHVKQGDVRDSSAIERAMKGCNLIFHLAADYRLWVPDAAVMYDINVKGTCNVMVAAMKSGVEKVVYTSSVGTLAASIDGKQSTEETPVSFSDMYGHYKRSKFLAEREVYGFVDKGLPVVIVNPSTPVGPMDTKPTPTGRIIVDFLNGRMPAYLDTGLNFADVEDVACGHLLACQYGIVGEKYILGNRNMSLGDFLGLIARITGRKPPLVRLPYLPVLAAAYINELISNVTKRPPLIPLTGVRMARRYMYFDSSKAVRDFKLPQGPIEIAIEKAIAWFSDNGYLVKRKGAL
jgi:dihydroflavonol-4-reductase